MLPICCPSQLAWSCCWCIGRCTFGTPFIRRDDSNATASKQAKSAGRALFWFWYTCNNKGHTKWKECIATLFNCRFLGSSGANSGMIFTVITSGARRVGLVLKAHHRHSAVINPLVRTMASNIPLAEDFLFRQVYINEHCHLKGGRRGRIGQFFAYNIIPII